MYLFSVRCIGPHLAVKRKFFNAGVERHRLPFWRVSGRTCADFLAWRELLGSRDMETLNRQILLAARPVGLPKESDFRLVESPMPRPRPGEVLVRALYLSVDPYMRGRMRQNGSYARNVDVGEVMVGGIVGRVVESNDPRLAVGDLVEGMLGWQEYAIAPTKA